MSYAQQEACTAAPAKNIGLNNDHGGVDKEKVTISRGSEVTWSSHGHGHATIVFDSPKGSPFACGTFYLPKDGSVSSGPAIRGGGGEEFKYTVHGKKGDNDPVIAVDP